MGRDTPGVFDKSITENINIFKFVPDTPKTFEKGLFYRSDIGLSPFYTISPDMNSGTKAPPYKRNLYSCWNSTRQKNRRWRIIPNPHTFIERKDEDHLI